RLELLPDVACGLHRVAGAGAAGIFQRAVIVIAEHERADRAFEMRGILVAEDDKFLVLLAFRLDPVVAAARAMRRVAPLRDHAFETELAGVREPLLSAALEMIAVADNAVWIAISEHRLQRGLAREQRF